MVEEEVGWDEDFFEEEEEEEDFSEEEFSDEEELVFVKFVIVKFVFIVEVKCFGFLNFVFMINFIIIVVKLVEFCKFDDRKLMVDSDISYDVVGVVFGVFS